MAEAEFAQKIDTIVNHSWITVGLSIGSRLGLFRGLADLSQCKDTSVTSLQLADRLDMKERYVREWICGMACGGIVDHCEIEGEDRFWITPYRLPALVGTPSTHENCTKKVMYNAQRGEQLTGALGDYREVEKCYYKDGPSGTKVDNYPILHEFLSKRNTSFQTLDHAAVFLGGTEMLDRLKTGISVLEIGCGAGHPSKLLAENFPASQFVASDLSEDCLTRARANMKGLKNVEFAVLDACEAVNPELKNKFDLVMLFDVFHDVAYPNKMISVVHEMLRDGGKFLILDVPTHGSLTENIKHAEDPERIAYYYTVSMLYCVPTSLYFPGGAGLGACAGAPQIRKLLEDGGFKVERLDNDYGLCLMCTK